MIAWDRQKCVPLFLELLLAVVTTILILARFLPATPNMLGDWLDAGWAVGVNAAFVKGLQFGRDVTFNYGPYSAVATHVYDPAARTAMTGGGMLLGISFAAGVTALRRPRAACCAALLLPLVTLTDSLAFAIALPAILVCVEPPTEPRRVGGQTIAILGVLPALALLPLIKGSYLGVALVDVSALAILSWLTGRRWLAASIVPGTIACILLLWLLAGQHPSCLPAYFTSTIDIISGHNEAMATPGTYTAFLCAVMPCVVFVCLLLVRVRSLPRGVLATLAISFAALLFIVFKAGYVRADPDHEALTLASLAWLLLLLSVWLGGRLAIGAAAVGLVLLFTGPFAAPNVVGKIIKLPVALAFELRSDWRFLSDPAGVAHDAAETLAEVQPLSWKPAGTSDIYSFGQLRLIATGLAWDPRPMFQSYSAFTPTLARRNADHLLHDAAPDNVFFRVEPVDGRLPALEDGLSWLPLQSLYEPVGYDGSADLAWLRRVPSVHVPPVVSPVQFAASGHLGETVTFPSTPNDLWARIDIRPTISGRAAGLLWQAPLLRITLAFADGRRQTFRLIPGMARAGFLLSPFVSSTLDFLKLRQLPGGSSIGLARPIAMTVDADPSGAWAWQPGYSLQLGTIDFPRLDRPVSLKNLPEPRQVASPSDTTPSTCVLDEVDGSAVPTASMQISWPVTLAGWSLFDLASRQQGDATTILFYGSGGHVYEMPSVLSQRNDVRVALQLPDADRAGFVRLVSALVVEIGVPLVGRLPLRAA